MPPRSQTITVRATKAEVLRVIRSLPGRLRRGDPSAVLALTRLGLTAQKLISGAFKQKALGLPDASGLRWPTLAPLTVRLKRRVAPQNATRILREFDDLLHSLEPAAPPENAVIFRASLPQKPLAVFQMRPGVVRIGTSRQWALSHHRGKPGFYPQRRLWPETQRFPQAWWRQLLAQARSGVIDVVKILLGNAP